MSFPQEAPPPKGVARKYAPVRGSSLSAPTSSKSPAPSPMVTGSVSAQPPILLDLSSDMTSPTLTTVPQFHPPANELALFTETEDPNPQKVGQVGVKQFDWEQWLHPAASHPATSSAQQPLIRVTQPKESTHISQPVQRPIQLEKQLPINPFQLPFEQWSTATAAIAPPQSSPQSRISQNGQTATDFSFAELSGGKGGTSLRSAPPAASSFLGSISPPPTENRFFTPSTSFHVSSASSSSDTAPTAASHVPVQMSTQADYKEQYQKPNGDIYSVFRSEIMTSSTVLPTLYSSNSDQSQAGIVPAKVSVPLNSVLVPPLPIAAKVISQSRITEQVSKKEDEVKAQKQREHWERKKQQIVEKCFSFAVIELRNGLSLLDLLFDTLDKERRKLLEEGKLQLYVSQLSEIWRLCTRLSSASNKESPDSHSFQKLNLRWLALRQELKVADDMPTPGGQYLAGNICGICFQETINVSHAIYHEHEFHIPCLNFWMNRVSDSINDLLPDD